MGVTALPPPPSRSFASDNSAGALPEVMDAVVAANVGHALAYGADPWTARATDLLHDLFGGRAVPYLVLNGTGANVMALATLAHPGEAVVCSEWAHIAVDETGAPERVAGVKLLCQPSSDAKLTPAQVESLAHLRGVQHHAQPTVVSITQSTELGTVYTPGEVAALCESAHRLGMRVHLDGARIANATAALGGDIAALRAFTVDAGVDVVTFGGTKAGLLGGEAVVYLDADLAFRAPFVRKQVDQLSSKMRFVAAQFEALLTDDLWLRSADHANQMARRLYESTRSLPGVEYDIAPVVNSVFPRLPAHIIAPLSEWCFFYEWDPTRHQVRWMTSWDTTVDDVDRFVAGVRWFLGT